MLQAPIKDDPMKHLSLLIFLAMPALTARATTQETKKPETRSTLSEAEAFQKFTKALAEHPGLAGYKIKARFGSLSWDKDRRKENPGKGVSSMPAAIKEAYDAAAPYSKNKALSVHFDEAASAKVAKKGGVDITITR
jgi:hypothetical protein